jgi:hypothetical protein
MATLSRRRVIAVASVLVALIPLAVTASWLRLRSRVLYWRRSEATHMVQSIRVAEEAFRAEMGTYANISKALAANQRTNHFALYPQAPREPGDYAVSWGGECPSSACRMSWSMLPVHADGRVRFGYSVVAGRAGERPTAVVTIDGVPVAWPVPDEDWYIVTAVGDVDGTGVFTTVLGTSFGNDLRFDGANTDR